MARRNYWFLIKQMSVTDFKLRYNSSVLGYLWSLLNPLLMFTVLYIVFSIFMRFEGVEHYQLYLLLGIIIWTYFSEATTSGMNSILFKSSLISKINFPKWILVVSSNITALLTLLLNLVVVVVFFIISDVVPTRTALVFPLYVLELLAFSFAVSLVLSSYFLRFRDLNHLWTVLLTIGFWMTPIIYPIQIVPQKIQQLLMINPLARIITDIRDVLIYGTVPGLRHNLITLGMIGVVLVAGIYLFSRNSPKFAEQI